jgi:hypothetical protein
VNGEPGLVEDVQMVIAEIEESSFAWDTAPVAIFPAVTALESIFPEVTASEPILSAVTAPVPILSAVMLPEPMDAVGVTMTHAVPSYSHVLSPDENVWPFVGEDGKSIGITD